MLIISTHGHSAFRSEELEAVYLTVNEDTHRFTKIIRLQYKSGRETLLHCKTIKEAKELFESIIDIMKKDYII